jgi:hypothetical protein
MPLSLSGYSDEQIKFVMETWTVYKKSRRKIRMNAFAKVLRKQWRQKDWLTPAPSRQTIADMLKGNGKRAVESTQKKSRYHESVKKFFPNAQACLDGKQIDISINDHAYHFTVEMAKDLASDAITAIEFGKSETAELVEKTYDHHAKSFGHPVSVLLDNGSGNKKATVKLGQEGSLVVRAHPYRAETKGQLEGEFGQFERLTSPIQIRGQDQESLALSFAQATVEMYAMLRNQTPRCSNCPFTPEEMMKYQSGELEIKSAWDYWNTRKKKKEMNRAKRIKIGQERQELIESVAKEQQLEGDLMILKKSLKFIELSTIKAAELAFAVQSKRDDFDHNKQTMAYFYGIAKRIQDKKNNQRKKKVAQRRYGLDQQSRQYRQSIEIERQEILRQKEFEKKPWLSLATSIANETRLSSEFKSFSVFRKKIDHTLCFMLGKGERRFQNMIKKTEKAIMELVEFPIQTRFEMVKYVKERIKKLTITEAKTVTP